MSYCPKCGAENQDGDRFCRSCGASVVSAREGAASVPSAAGPTGRTHPLAVGSLVAAVLWFGGLGAIAAIILGIMARREIDQAGSEYSGRGVATAGMWLGIAGLVIPLLAMAVLLGGGRSTMQEVAGPGMLDLQYEAGVMNMESALKGAARAQNRYKQDHGSYASHLHDLDLDIWQGVRLEQRSANADSFCIEGTSPDAPGTTLRITQARRTRQGPCP